MWATWTASRFSWSGTKRRGDLSGSLVGGGHRPCRRGGVYAIALPKAVCTAVGLTCRRQRSRGLRRRGRPAVWESGSAALGSALVCGVRVERRIGGDSARAGGKRDGWGGGDERATQCRRECRRGRRLLNRYLSWSSMRWTVGVPSRNVHKTLLKPRGCCWMLVDVGGCRGPPRQCTKGDVLDLVIQDAD